MSKAPFPPITDELHSTPKPKVDVNLTPRVLPEVALDEGARQVGEKWGSVTQLQTPQQPIIQQPAPEPEPKLGREEWINTRFECPPYLDLELSMRAVSEFPKATKSYLILKALKDAGYTVHDEDLVRDRRKQRK